MKTKKILAGILSAALLCQPAAASVYCAEKTSSKTLAGDVNNDGRFNIADILSLKKWLVGDGELLNKDNADFYEDGQVDVFDLCLMQNELIESLSIPSPLYKSRNLCADYEAAQIDAVKIDEDFVLGQTKFSLDFLQHSLKQDGNTLISPYSATRALAMTANGAKGKTLEEMENVLCGGVSIDKLNEYIYSQTNQLTAPSPYDNSSLNDANSIWVRPDINIAPDFIGKNVSYFDSQIFTSPMDKSTVNDVNQWVNIQTHEMIPELLDPEQFNDSGLLTMLLVNALAFEGQWADEFGNAVNDKFTAYNGNIQNAEMMSSRENVFLKDDKAKGFVKDYLGNYYFAALLPDEGITVDEYISGLDAESLHSILSNKNYKSVDISMPKFSFDDSRLMKDMLIDMGMPTAFDADYADFTGMTTDNYPMSIDEVLQKTHIEVDEKGTRAAAATVVMMKETGCIEYEEPEVVRLDRPFVFAIVDSRTDIPIFMGTVKTLNK